MHQYPDTIILAWRMPPGLSVLCDMKHWSWAELDLWMSHLLARQRGQIPQIRIFAWRDVHNPQKEVV
jgi:hypothetical protein